MRISNISARNWPVHRLSARFTLMLALFAAPLGAAGAVDVSCQSDFLIIRNDFIKNAQAPAPVAVQPVTTFLSPGDDARIVFRPPASASGDKAGDKALRFRIFETNGVGQDSFQAQRELPVLATAPAPEGLVAGFLPGDSTLIRFQLRERPIHRGQFWAHRSFVVVRCQDGKVVNWGVVRARVSNVPITIAICVVVLLLMYLLAMASVWLFHNVRHPLADKYPAYEVRRKMTLRDFLNPIHLMADAFHRGSVAKFQVVLFSFLVGGLLLSLVLENGVLIALSGTVVGLLGIVGAGAAVGQSTANFRNRMDFDNWTWLVTKNVLPINEAAGASPRWRDLVTTNREFDVYKLQALIFSVAVALALLAAGASSLSSFDVPQTLLGILALSQGIFVAGVLVRPPAVGDLDKALTDLRQAEERARVVVTHNDDVDADGNLPLTLKQPDPNVPFSARRDHAKNALQRYKKLADRVEIMIESTLETEIQRQRLDPDLGENRRILSPQGGPGGDFFSFDPIDHEFEIAGLDVWSGTVIDAIQINYRHRRTRATMAFKSTGLGGTLSQLVLNPGEFITRVEGGGSPYVVWIKVYTSRGRQMSWGGPAAAPGFDFRCDNDEEIIGFEGRTGDYIDAIGAIVRTRR